MFLREIIKLLFWKSDNYGFNCISDVINVLGVDSTDTDSA